MSAESKSNSLTALLIGGTGATGRHILRGLLASPHFARVVEVGRRATPLENLQDAPGKEKLVQKIVNFDNIEQEGLAEVKADALVIAMGTNSRHEDFLKLEGYVLNAARAAKTDNESQRIVYLSGASAHPKAMFYYSRTKGQTEHALAKLGYSDLVVLRPALMLGRVGETTTKAFMGALLNRLPGREWTCIHVQKVAKCMVRVAETGSAGLPKVAEATVESPPDTSPYHALGNRGIINFSDVGESTTLLAIRGLAVYGSPASPSRAVISQ
ncbi:Protein fmp52, mitochondrial [Tulasnella sp. 403]|nr:Protein fmp52, mitochondrial [Tulasnella sp. 403]